MKPVAFDYERPSTLADAAVLLGQANGFSKVLAGGQSLGPMLNLRLAQPDLLVDITSIAELTEVKDTADHLEIGACITHAAIEDGLVPDPARGMLVRAARSSVDWVDMAGSMVTMGLARTIGRFQSDITIIAAKGDCQARHDGLLLGVHQIDSGSEPEREQRNSHLFRPAIIGRRALDDLVRQP